MPGRRLLTRSIPPESGKSSRGPGPSVGGSPPVGRPTPPPGGAVIEEKVKIQANGDVRVKQKVKEVVRSSKASSRFFGPRREGGGGGGGGGATNLRFPVEDMGTCWLTNQSHRGDQQGLHPLQQPRQHETNHPWDKEWHGGAATSEAAQNGRRARRHTYSHPAYSKTHESATPASSPFPAAPTSNIWFWWCTFGVCACTPSA